MPVVISLFNALTGLAVAFEGFVLNNAAMIIAGTVVGSAGTLLTQLMARAMNRSIGNVLFSSFGATGDDEGAVLVWEDFPPYSPVSPGAEDVQSTIVMNVAKDGLSFTRTGAMLAIDLTLQAVVERGVDPMTHTLSSGVRMRNP